MAQLIRRTPAELEAIYAGPGVLSLPSGQFRGRHLAWLETRVAHHPVLRPVNDLVFARLPWCIDFDRRVWTWLGLPLGFGHFSLSAGPSRWRDTSTLRMLYDDRRLPGFFNQFLYDEVKPLSDDVCLGIGGVSRARGDGDQFFFALERVG